MTFDLAIFDCDGVLVDTEPISSRVYANLMGELGLRVTADEVLREFVGRSRVDNLAAIEQRLGCRLPPEFGDEYERRTFAAYELQLTPIPGIVEVLANLSMPVCVASSGNHEKMHRTLGLTGLLERFDGHIFSASEVERGKPFPDIFLLAARRMGVPPARCVVVEDSVPGVQAGIAAGMSVLGYGKVSSPDRLERAGAKVFLEMSQLPELLEV